MTKGLKMNTEQILLVNSDCLDFLQGLEDESVDLFVTDPPYEIANTNTGKTNGLGSSIQGMLDELSASGICSSFDVAILNEMKRVCKGLNMYFFCNRIQLPMYFDYFLKDKNVKFELIKWIKTNPAPTFNNKYVNDTEYCFYVQSGNKCNPNNYNDALTVYTSKLNTSDKKAWLHPTIKPVPLLEKFIRNSSIKGDLVCDPFSGSGSTAIASISEGRRFAGSEINKKWFDLSVERIEKHQAQRSLF